MIGGANKEPKGWTILTGIGAVRPLKVNPSNEEYEIITGGSMPYDLNYDITELGEVKYRPIRILVHNEQHDVYSFVNFYISDEDEVSKAGDKVNSIDPKGVITYKPIDGNVNYDWFDSSEATPLKRGEAPLHNFLQILVKYDNKAKEANWRMDLLQAEITSAKIYAGNMTGLQALIDWSNLQVIGDHKGHQIGVLFEVKKSAKMNKDTGEEIPNEFNYNQVLNNRHFFYASSDGTIPNGAYKRLRAIRDKQEKDGYQVTKNLWTFALQEFKESDCEGVEPAETTEISSNAEANPMKWV